MMSPANTIKVATSLTISRKPSVGGNRPEIPSINHKPPQTIGHRLSQLIEDNSQKVLPDQKSTEEAVRPPPAHNYVSERPQSKKMNKFDSMRHS
mgnify:CR=1 FL=1